MNLKNVDKIYLLCSPNFGIVDNWLPVIDKIHQKYNHISFEMIFPKAATVEILNLEDDLVKISEKYFSAILYKNHDGGWSRSDTYFAAKEHNTRSSSSLFFKKWKDRVGRIFKIQFVFNFFTKIFSSLFGDVSPFPKISSSSVLFYDVGEELKDYSKEILKAFNECPCYSIFHGVNIETEKNYTKLPTGFKTSNTKSFLFSEKEREYYREAFKLEDRQLCPVGIQRHDKNWVELVKTNSRLDFTSSSKFVFLVSRPAGPFLPLSKKRKFVKHLKKVIIEEMGLDLVIRLHPKELDEGIYDSVLGRDNLGKNWHISKSHCLTLSAECVFGITYYSGVCLDLIYLGKNVIEMLDLVGLDGFDHANANRDSNGTPIFSYRFYNFVYGVSSESELRDKARKILDKPEESLAFLKESYKEAFGNESALDKTIDVLENQ